MSSPRRKTIKQLIERVYNDKELVKFTHDIPINPELANDETLEERLNRLRTIDPEEIVSGKFAWIDEVLLVALGKKPIAMTHFDVVEEWDYSAELWALNNGVNQYVTFEVPYDVDIESARSKYISTISGKVRGKILAANNQVESIIWYREDTKKQALLLKKFFTRRIYKHITWSHVYHDIIQGLLYGYSEQAIEKYLSDEDFHSMSSKSFNHYLQESKTYIKNEIEEQKSDSWNDI